MGQDISVRVCLADGNTPLELADPCVPWVYRDIMVGTRLTIIVDSNADGAWSGGLYIPGTDHDYGRLYCKGLGCEYSVLPAAGGASVVDYADGLLFGYSLLTYSDAVAGDWFIIDYNAISVGDCNVGLYDDSYSFDIPWQEMSFTHVPSRDFNGDHIVNFTDFAVLGLYWGITDCTDPYGCKKVDFDGDGTVDINDLRMFVEYWLERTD